MSKITSIRTLRIKERPNLIWVEVETDEGIVGLGETFRGTDAVESVIHEQLSPALIGQDARDIEAISRQHSAPYVGYGSSSAEIRAMSAIDIALWDLAGKRLSVPTYEVLGGASRHEIQVYNTCAGYSFNTSSGQRRSIGQNDRSIGPYDDQIAFNRDAGALAESLLEESIKAMKIWPFDDFASASQGQYISLEQLKKGLEPFAKVRHAVGDKIEVMCELHGLWASHPAERICRALEEFDVFWVEDPIAKMDNIAVAADLRSRVSVPICGSETLAGLPVYRDLLAANAIDVVMLDLTWCGGLTVGRKIATLAETYAKPIAPHDCTGPVSLMAGINLALHAPTAIYQEVVRAYLSTWYQEIVTELPILQEGNIQRHTTPGLGVSLNPDVFKRADAIVRVSGTRHLP